VMVFTIGGSPTESPVTAPHTHINLPVQDLKLIAETIARKKPDVLIYTDIGMDPLSYYLGFHRLAPVQCVTWGHPVTTGIPTMDYFISSRLFEPEDNAQEHYSEQLVQLDTLPAFYQRPTLDESQEVSRAAFGFTSDEHIYLCPQTLLKFHPEFDSTLASILNQDPQGVLVLVNAYTPQWGDRLMERFEKTLPDARHRVRILDRQSFPSFWIRLALAGPAVCTNPWPWACQS
jgi:protein O-GlcNAc transferase